MTEAHNLRGVMEVMGHIPDVYTYSSLIHGELSSGESVEALKLLSEMKQRGLIPDFVIYTAIISVLSKQGKADEALRLYTEMLEAGIIPDYRLQSAMAGSLATASYMNYIGGDDDAVEDLDRECIGKFEKERDSASHNVKEFADEVTQLEEKLQTGPTEREKLEKESSLLEEDVNKFNAMIAGFDERIRKMMELVEEKDKEMEEKLGEHKRICHENEELKKKVELLTFNARDAEMMKKELQAVETERY
ncbi:hypothetical protein Dsin_021805 [Dipteronia sinensis]|uniref:Pentatricopeptide repeat-containing protein n=1 Tax=Dipteronia sinensis TaxID=43782 RepID=A0AAE0A0C4_9ROSI|nr:hypothetical protein Dsin_021805 [Dipteronia sinensis]